MREIPVIICLDVEPDEREIDSTVSKDWEGFEESLKYFSALRPRLEEATGARASFSWFFRMDPQIEHTYGLSWWVAQRYGEAIKQLKLAGDEIGLHAHAWRWDAWALKWVVDHGDQSWVNHCLHTSFEAYRIAFGCHCLAFRFGDRWMNNETMALLESLGVQFDLTVEPGKTARPGLHPWELHTGSLPDYLAAPRRPYRPSRRDFREHSRARGRGLWVVPLSTQQVLGRFAGLKRAAMAFGIFQRRYEACQLNLCLDGPLFQLMVNRLLQRPGRPYLAPVARTEIGVCPEARANMGRNVDFLLSHPLVRRFRFVRPAEAIKLLAEEKEN
jgi:hypothetical protein